MIMNITKNRMGTSSFDGKFKGMRKAQDFTVYPIHAGDETDKIKIQSDTRIGYIDLKTGDVIMSPSIPSGAYNPHLALAKKVDVLTQEHLLLLKSNVMATASGAAGTNGVVITDNSGAIDVFNN